MNYIIRPATIYDIDEIYEIEKLCFDEIDRFSKDYFYLFLLKKRFEIFYVIIVDLRNTPKGKICGFIVAFLNDIKNYEIATVNVHPDWQRKGFGYSLMIKLEKTIEKAIPELKKLDIINQKQSTFTIELTVYEKNDGAKRLYKKLGYKEIEKIPNYYQLGRNGIRMIKIIKIP